MKPRNHVFDAGEEVVTRFAPSPTGYLHLGHVVAALYVHAIGRYFGARILLRIEDHDRSRCRMHFEQEIYKDLHWLGFVYDNFQSLDLGLDPKFHQSTSDAVYQSALKGLLERNLVYSCYCSRKDLAKRLGGAALAGGELIYDSLCRDIKRGSGKAGEGPKVLRLKVPTETEYAFEELNRGRLMQKPGEQCGDFVIFDKNDCFTYQFCVVVDDLRHGINLVVRGEDIFPSTGRQIYLAHLLGGVPAKLYFHHKLIKDNNKKLAKRKGSFAIKNLRESHYDPKKLLAEAMSLAVGHTYQSLSLDDAIQLLLVDLKLI